MIQIQAIILTAGKGSRFHNLTNTIPKCLFPIGNTTILDRQIDLLLEQNIDDITERSIEIPGIGTLLCATRTRSHQKILIENKEAIFFKNANECYKKCNSLLSDIRKINKMRLKI